jgi:cell division protein FtsL
MLTIEFTINIFVFAIIVLAAVLIGFSLRSSQLKRCHSKIEELEREILNNYAHILELEKENTSMETKLQDIEIPVIAMKPAPREEQQQNQKVPDITLRKKLLSKENLQKQSASGK